jgi:hypothetical protein
MKKCQIRCWNPLGQGPVPRAAKAFQKLQFKNQVSTYMHNIYLNKLSLTCYNAAIDQIPPRPKPKVLGKVYRVKGIPEEYGIDETKAILRLQLNSNESTKINIRSLAISEHRGEKVSVVEFTPEPVGLGSGKDQWPYNIEMADERKIGITIDTHFRGLTVLRSPSRKDHNLE